MNNDFLYSTARVLNKDIYIIESPGSQDDNSVFRGGAGGGQGKGAPLLLGHLASHDAGGKDYYQSLVLKDKVDRQHFLDSLTVTEQRS